MTKTKTVEQSKFTKLQVYKSEKYKNRKDLINVLLEDDKTYTVKEIDELIKKFLERKIDKKKQKKEE